nr:hypothetical protein [Variovorax sp. J22R187]
MLKLARPAKTIAAAASTERPGRGAPPAPSCVCARTTAPFEALPRAETASLAATHAPRASFQILVYDLFIRQILQVQIDAVSRRPSGRQRLSIALDSECMNPVDAQYKDLGSMILKRLCAVYENPLRNN